MSSNYLMTDNESSAFRSIVSEPIEVTLQRQPDEILKPEDWIHPFDHPPFRAYLEAEFPDLTQRIDTAHRPTISVQPDELEAWEVEQILLRRKRASFETDYAYLMRLLYEETFSVN